MSIDVIASFIFKTLTKQLKYIFIIFITTGVLMSATLEHIQLNTKQSKQKIDVIYEHSNDKAIITIELIFKNQGYLNDLKDGLSSVSSAIFNEGSKKDGSILFASKLENEAITLYSSYGRDYFKISLQCLSESKQIAINLLKQLLEDVNYDNKVLEKIKSLKIGVIKSNEDDYNYVAQKELKALVYANTPLAKMPSGEKDDIENITIKDIKNKLKNVFGAKSLVVVASGDITLKQLEKDLNYILSSIEDGEINNITKTQVIADAKIKTVKKDTTQAYIYFASPYYGDIKNDYKAQIASFILGSSGFSSRLMNEIRVKKGLAYSIYGYYENSQTSSSFVGYMQSDLNKAQKSIKTIQKIVDNFVDEGISKEELKQAKAYILGSEPLKNELLSSRVSRSYGFYIKNLPLNYGDIKLKLIKDITLEQINSFIKKHNEIKKLSFALVIK
jgi:predicted Zn-dependent peptidase